MIHVAHICIIIFQDGPVSRLPLHSRKRQHQDAPESSRALADPDLQRLANFFSPTSRNVSFLFVCVQSQNPCCKILSAIQEYIREQCSRMDRFRLIGPAHLERARDHCFRVCKLHLDSVRFSPMKPSLSRLLLIAPLV